MSGVLVLVGVSAITFALFNLLPGSAAQQLLGADATSDQIAYLEAELQLDHPPWERYGIWVGQVLTGDLGYSLASRQPVIDLIASRLSVTLELIAFALVLAIGFALPVALFAAYRPNSLADRFSGMVSIAALSIPNYVLAPLLVLSFAISWRLFPSIGFVSLSDSIGGNIHSLILPAAALAAPLFGLYCRFLRGDLLEQMRREAYIATAAAKGLGRWSILVRHALRNSLLGLLALIGLHVSTLVGGAVIIEEIFAVPGIGRLLLQAVHIRDVPVAQCVVLLMAAVTVVASFVVDLSYLILDPRIKYAS